jgi:hypothetical protein
MGVFAGLTSSFFHDHSQLARIDTAAIGCLELHPGQHLAARLVGQTVVELAREAVVLTPLSEQTPCR